MPNTRCASSAIAPSKTDCERAGSSDGMVVVETTLCLRLSEQVAEFEASFADCEVAMGHFEDSLGRRYRTRPGRKPRTDETSDRGVCIRLTATERAELESVASENSCSLTDLLRDALNSFVADYREKSVFVR